MKKQSKAAEKRRRRAFRNDRHEGAHSDYAIVTASEIGDEFRESWSRKRGGPRFPLGGLATDPAAALATIPALLAMSAHAKRAEEKHKAGIACKDGVEGCTVDHPHLFNTHAPDDYYAARKAKAPEADAGASQ